MRCTQTAVVSALSFLLCTGLDCRQVPEDASGSPAAEQVAAEHPDDPSPSSLYTLHVQTRGVGYVTVNGEHVSSATFSAGMEVTIRAEAYCRLPFVGWEGDVAGTEPVAHLTMDSDRSVTAVFEDSEAPPPKLHEEITGLGSLRYEPAEHDWGDLVTITAVAEPGWHLARWDGSLSGSENPVMAVSFWTTHIKAVFEEDVRWVPMESPTTATLNGLSGCDDGQVWAVGDDGTLVHFDGSKWTLAGAAGLESINFMSVWAGAPNRIHAGGYEKGQGRGVLYRFQGAGWEPVDMGLDLAGYSVISVWEAPEGDIFLVVHKRQNDCHVVRYDGHTWSWVMQTSGLNGVHGTGRNDVYAFATGTFHYDGQSWSLLTPFSATSGGCVVRPGFFYGAGSGLLTCRDGACQRTLMLENLHDVWVSRGGQVYAAGYRGIFRNLLQEGRPETFWRMRTPEGTADYNAIWGLDQDRIYVAGTRGTILQVSRE